MADMLMNLNVALAAVPVNSVPLVSDSDFKSIQASVVYDAAGMALNWNFVTAVGAFSQTAVVPTNSGNHLWTGVGAGMYALQVPASGGTINNDTAGFGWFSGVATGILPWRGPIIEFKSPVLTEVATFGNNPTRDQALLMIHQLIGQFAISGTDYVVKATDNSTTLATFQLDDADNPTSLHRVS